jgi:uncharacterized protein YndB with AHSA1/START domain
MTAEKITISAIIKVAKTMVWDYYTLPEHITKWNFADPSWHCPSASNDMEIGGKYLARMEAKDGSFGFDFEAYYTSLNPGENFTYEFAGRTVIVEFKDKNASTEVIVSFDPETENPIELQKNGWQAILNNFKKYCEQI